MTWWPDRRRNDNNLTRIISFGLIGAWLILCLVIPSVFSGQTATLPRPVLHPEYNDLAQTLQALQSPILWPSHPQSVVGALVNHHLLAARYIRDTLAPLASTSVRRVILVSPNHFFAGRGWVGSIDWDFSTPFGTVRTDQAAVAALKPAGVVVGQADVFHHEHGIYNILPYIKLFFPNAMVVPVILKDGTPPQLIERVRRILDRDLGPGILVIGSFDFSHYQTSAVADQQDANSLIVLNHFQHPTVTQASVDSHEGLLLTMELVTDSGARGFRLVHHSNSGKLTGNLNSHQTTSYITGWFTR